MQSERTVFAADDANLLAADERDGKAFLGGKRVASVAVRGGNRFGRIDEAEGSAGDADLSLIHIS